MRCPSCGSEQSAPAPACESCGMTLKSLDAKFGFVPRHRPIVSDLALALTADEVRKLENLADGVTRIFPGVQFSVLFCKLSPGRNVAEYCFWMMNRGHFTEADAKLGRSRTILLLVDTERPAAALMVGYGLEHVLPRQSLEEILGRIAEPLRRRSYMKMVTDCIASLRPVLRESIERISRHSKDTAPTVSSIEDLQSSAP